jgi:hypothetical protein
MNGLIGMCARTNHFWSIPRFIRRMSVKGREACPNTSSGALSQERSAREGFHMPLTQTRFPVLLHSAVSQGRNGNLHFRRSGGQSTFSGVVGSSCSTKPLRFWIVNPERKDFKGVNWYPNCSPCYSNIRTLWLFH